MKNSLRLLLFLLPIIAHAQTNQTIEGLDIRVTTYGGYDIVNTTPTNLIFRNNSVTSNSSAGFIVKAGEDDHNAYAYNLNGAKIYGNKLYWDGTSGGTHGLMVGYSIDYDIKYNYIDNSKYGIIHEGGLPGSITMVNKSGGMHYNIIKNCYMGVVEKGFDYTPIYNNTFYSDQSPLFLIAVNSSSTGGYDAVCRNVKIKNNIFYCTTTSPAIRIGVAGDDTAAEMDTVGFECDYNVYYYPNRRNYEPVFQVNDRSVSWSEWRAMGYDKNSVIVNPNFIDTKNFVPRARLDYGTNLGDGVNNGLSTSAQWVPGVSPELASQSGTWQVGAIVHGGTPEPDPDPDPIPDPVPGPVGGDYFVAPNGNDNNPGTKERPWATWEKAFNSTAVQPGDTVYFRGGIYYHTKTQGGYGWNCSRNGTANNYIHYFAYPGEKPILDCSTIKTVGTLNFPLYTTNINYIHFKGLTVRNVWQSHGGVTAGAWTFRGKNIIVEEVTIYNTHGHAFRADRCDELYYINCDTWDNCDSLTNVPADNPVPGNDGTGFFEYNPESPYFTVYYKGCRAWKCGDQGFSTGSIGSSVYDDCWSWSHGMLEGGGHGFKMGWVSTITQGVTNRTYRRCIAAFNRKRGWDSNDQHYQSGSFDVFNNIAYRNLEGFRIWETNDSQANELRRVYRNNVAFQNTSLDLALGRGANYTHSHNSWDSNITLNANHFVSLDNTDLSAPRKKDGSLPDIYFLKPADGSVLIDKGTNVNLPYNGARPDIGYAEYGSTPVRELDITNYTPNPTYDDVTISYYSSKSTSINITIRNSAGAVAQRMTHNAKSGDNQVVILSDLIADTYDITLDNGSVTDNCQVTKLNQEPVRILEITGYAPNPTYNDVTISYYSPNTKAIGITVTNNTGATVKTLTTNASTGNNQVTVGLTELAAATYTITLNDGVDQKSIQVNKIDQEPVRVLEITSYVPNPTSDDVTISYYSPNTKAIGITVTNNTGATVKTLTANASTGNNQVTVGLTELAAATYTITLNDGVDQKSIQVNKIDQEPVRVLEITSYVPNPTSDDVTISYYTPYTTDVRVTVVDNAGSTLKTIQTNSTAGNNQVVVGLAELSAGAYTIYVNDMRNRRSCQVNKIDQEPIRVLEITGYAPNPTYNDVTISYYSPETKTINITVTNNSGSTVKTLTTNANTGDNQVIVGLTELAAATYTITLNDGVNQKSIQVNKIDQEPVRVLEINSYVPNPTYDDVTISYYTPYTTDVRVTVVDNAGNTHKTIQTNSTAGNNQVVVGLAELSAGAYTIYVNDMRNRRSCQVNKIDQEPIRVLEITSYSPNPTYDDVNISYYSPKSTTINITVVYSSGALAKNQTTNASAGNNQVVVSLDKLIADTYTITLNDGENIKSFTITKLTKVEPINFKIIRGSPTPTVDLFTVTFNCPTLGTILIKAFDKNNSLVLSEVHPTKIGRNKAVLNLSQLQTGSYTVILYYNDNEYKTKVYKQESY